MKGIDQVVLDGLRWLARHQNPDGSWGALALKSRCIDDPPCFDPALRATDNYDEGLTGMALLCFLDAGFSPELGSNVVHRNLDKEYQFKEIIVQGLEWLRARQQSDGSFSRDRAFMYNEAFATMAMVEAYGLTQDPYWKEPAQKAVDFLQSAQRLNPSGAGSWGWRYTSRAEIEEWSRRNGGYERHDSDTSITGLCVVALSRAHRHGLNVDQSSMSGAMEFCEFVTANDGLVGYLDAKGAGATVTGPFDDRFVYHHTTMSAMALCMNLIVKADPWDAFPPLAAKRIVGDLPRVTEDRSSIDHYYWLFATLALGELDGPGRPKRTGKYWNPWQNALLEAVPVLQDRTENACSTGGWLVSDRWGSYTGTGPVYNTAMSVLTLEVLFRY